MARTFHVPSAVKDPELIRVRRNEIISAAVRLFIEKGFHKTTTREIASAAGLGIGTLYEYIATKEDVLFLVCDQIHNDVEQKLNEAIIQGPTGLDALIQSVRSFIHVMDEMQDAVLLLYQESSSLPPDKVRHVLEREEQITHYFMEILTRGIQDGSIHFQESNLHLMAHNIVVLGQMWTFRRWALSKRYTLQEYIEHQVAWIRECLSH